MKKIILFATVAWFCSINLFAQNGSPVISYTYNTPYETVKVKPVKNGKVKNVIFMVGDGMGLVQVSAAWVANRGKLNLDNCTYTGFSRTYCANKLITDSGAGGTAFATGHKTNYHSVGVDATGKPVTSLTELAHSNGLKTGIVVTCNLTDATPSDYCAHNVDRDQEDAIATDYLKCNVDYIFGAGRERFNKRSDNRDLLAEMKQKGYQVCTSWEDTQKITKGKIFAIPSEGQLEFARERGTIEGDVCMHALKFLNQDSKGFFAMFEGSRIDDCGHFNDLPRLVEEVTDFDKVVGRVMEWAEKDGNTLVIVTADHETGGFILQDGNIASGSVSGSFASKEHSGIMVPVYAYGPGAENFTGIYENTELFHKIVKLLNLK